MTAIKAIETVYKGYRFRSRLEARWAVFFDTLGITWEYEPEGYVIEGTPYLPDFKFTLPTTEVVFAEVKNSEVDEDEGRHVDLCRGLANLTGCRVVLLMGLPQYRLYNQLIPNLPPNGFTLAFFKDYGGLLETADTYWCQIAVFDSDTGVMKFQGDERRMRKAFGQKMVDAVNAARQARFEHGEHGAPRPAQARPLCAFCRSTIEPAQPGVVLLRYSHSTDQKDSWPVHRWCAHLFQVTHGKPAHSWQEAPLP